MAIAYTVSVRGDFLEARAAGHDDGPDDVQAYAAAVINAAEQGGVTKVLCIETSLEYRLTIIETYEAALYLTAHAPRVARIAIVCDERRLPDARFWEDVVVNRGLLARAFLDEAAAREWLRNSSSAPVPHPGS